MSTQPIHTPAVPPAQQPDVIETIPVGLPENDTKDPPAKDPAQKQDGSKSHNIPDGR